MKYRERIKASPLASRLALGAFWSVFGAVISRGLSLIASIFVARMLGKEVFGELGIIQSTVGMFGIFAGFGLGLTATKYVAEFRKKDPAKAGRIIGLSNLTSIITGTLMSGALFGFSTALAVRTLAAPHLADTLRISAPMLLFGALNGAQTGALSGFEAFRAIATVNLVAGVSSFPLIIGGAYLGGLPGAVWGTVAGLVINCFLNQIALKKEADQFGIPLVYRNFSREWPILWKFSLPALLGGAFVGPANWICSAILVNRPRGYAEMGIFNAAVQWRTAILFVPAMLGAIVLPALASLQGENDHARYKKVLWYNIAINAGVALTATLVVSAFSPWIMKSYGPGFENSSIVLVLIGFSAVFSATSGVIGQSIASEGKMWWGMILNLLWAISLVGSAWFFVERGALGIALSNLIAYALHLLFVGSYSYRFIIKRAPDPRAI